MAKTAEELMQLWQTNKKAVYDMTQGADTPDKAMAVALVNQETPKAIDAAGRSVFGDQWTPAMANEAWGAFSSGGNYTWVDLDRFVSDFTRDPGVFGRELSNAVATQDQTDKNKQIQSAISPGSPLYAATFGSDPNNLGGIVGSEFGAFKSGLQPQQDLAQEKLSRDLAARGLSTSGALQAGEEDINKNYSNLLSQTLQGMMSQGQQNVLSSATGGVTNPDYQGVGNQLAKEESTREATAYGEAKKNASGWSWLLPAAELASTLLGQPEIATALGLGNAITSTGKKKTAATPTADNASLTTPATQANLDYIAKQY